MDIKRLVAFSVILTITIYISIFSSCTKEYSCEGCSTRNFLLPKDTINKKDTIKIDSTIMFPKCASCDSSQGYYLNRWIFRNYKSIICGDVYYSNLDSGRGVIIRGFQDCAKDTQFVITGSFPPLTFDSNQQNVPASYSNLLLYGSKTVVLAVAGGTNGTPLTMNMVLDTFNYSTGIASFRFFGYAYTNKGGNTYITGDSSYISDGRIRLKIR